MRNKVYIYILKFSLENAASATGLYIIPNDSILWLNFQELAYKF